MSVSSQEREIRYRCSNTKTRRIMFNYLLSAAVDSRRTGYIDVCVSRCDVVLLAAGGKDYVLEIRATYLLFVSFKSLRMYSCVQVGIGDAVAAVYYWQTLTISCNR